MVLKVGGESVDTAFVSEVESPTEAAASGGRGDGAGASGPRRRRSRLLMRGESMVASVGLALLVIVIGVVGACGWWLLHTQRASVESARQQHVETVSEILGGAVEGLLADGRVTPVRRLLMDAAERYELQTCRLVAPAGDVIAAADPSHITAEPADADWSGEVNSAPRVVREQGTLLMRRPVHVEGHGQAELEIAARLEPTGPPTWEAQAGVGVVGASSLLALLLVYRWFRSRLRAMGVVREALLALQRGETAESALAVAGDLGDEAAAWNQILEEHQQLRRSAVLERTREQHGPAPEGSSDLAAGCDAVSQGLLLVDEHMTIRYANNAAAVYLQARREALIHTRADEAISDEPVVEAMRNAVGGGLRRRETRELHFGENGQAGVIRFAIHPVRRGESASAMVVIDDVTQQRVAEQSRHEFVAQATHELRTPLTNLRLYLETLQDEPDDPATRGQALNVLNHETHRLERLVGDMLSVAEIEAGSFELNRDTVKVDALLNDVQQHYAAQANEKRITLTFQLPPKLPIVHGDRDKLMLTLQNLVSNAIKYTPEGGQVTVAAEAGNEQMQIEVRDTGIGIASDELEQVFEKFFRARDRRVNSTTGTGLGLALAREIARLHGGDITVSSQVDHGSTFTLTLPVQPDSETATG